MARGHNRRGSRTGRFSSTWNNSNVRAQQATEAARLAAHRQEAERRAAFEAARRDSLADVMDRWVSGSSGSRREEMENQERAYRAVIDRAIIDRAFGVRNSTDMNFPYLPDCRWVVLDPAFSDFSPAPHVVDWTGELLCIQPPDTKGEPELVPCRTVTHVGHLGPAVERLLKVGANFDLIVTDIHCGDTTPRTGFFAPPPPPLAKRGRRLLGADTEPLSPPPPSEPLPMAVAVWHTTHALLSPNGHALLRMHVADFNCVVKAVGKEKMPSTLWWVDITRTPVVDLYIAKQSIVNLMPLSERMSTEAPPSGRNFHVWPTDRPLREQGLKFREAFRSA